ncbi:MAG TPA: class I SAM-dependent methyltransferase [Candidatus Limnocylindrales bacterium]|nr:class I SAM-dependent methyltransferase [Candidatus Limnocylindrales bacterium]
MAEELDTAEERNRIRQYYASRGNRRWSGATYVVAERQQMLRRAVDFAGIRLDTAQILDVGCGTGGDLAFWHEQGVNQGRLFGTEILPERAAVAAAQLPTATIVPVDGFTLPFDRGAFQVVSASMVLSSIVDDAARALLFAEMLRVTSSGGAVAVYDFRVRKPGNHSVVAMNRRRVTAMGGRPDAVWPAAPFLPLLPAVLKLPAALRNPIVRVLPRTHVLYLWRR